MWKLPQRRTIIENNDKRLIAIVRALEDKSRRVCIQGKHGAQRANGEVQHRCRLVLERLRLIALVLRHLNKRIRRGDQRNWIRTRLLAQDVQGDERNTQSAPALHPVLKLDGEATSANLESAQRHDASDEDCTWVGQLLRFRHLRPSVGNLANDIAIDDQAGRIPAKAGKSRPVKPWTYSIQSFKFDRRGQIKIWQKIVALPDIVKWLFSWGNLTNLYFLSQVDL